MKDLSNHDTLVAVEPIGYVDGFNDNSKTLGACLDFRWEIQNHDEVMATMIFCQKKKKV